MVRVNYIDQIAGDIAAAVPQEKLPEGNTAELFRLYALLALSRGLETSGRDVHNAWSAWMAGREPDHDSLVPYEQLSKSVRAEDSPYLQAIIEVARKLQD